MEDLSVDTEQMTVENLFDVVNKSKAIAKTADELERKETQTLWERE